MGFDSECDLAIEAADESADEARLRAFVTGVRDGLLAEHLAVSPAAIADAIRAEGGSLIRAIDRVRHEGRTLLPIEPVKLDAADAALAENDLLDPERPPDCWHRLKRAAGLA